MPTTRGYISLVVYLQHSDIFIKELFKLLFGEHGTPACLFFQLKNKKAYFCRPEQKRKMGCLKLSYYYSEKPVHCNARSGKKVVQVWLSVDPMSDKYPEISPYAYCANNPIILVDPNGEDEWDLSANGTLTKRENGRTDVDVVHAEDKDGKQVSRTFEAGSINNNPLKYEYTKPDDTPATSQWLGAGGAFTADRTGVKLPNLHKISGEPLPRLRQTARCKQ